MNQNLITNKKINKLFKEKFHNYNKLSVSSCLHNRKKDLALNNLLKQLNQGLNFCLIQDKNKEILEQ